MSTFRGSTRSRQVPESRGHGEADSPRERARTGGPKTEDRPAPPLPRATGFCRQGISTSAWITATPPGKHTAGEEGPPPIAGPLYVPAALLGPANTMYQKPKSPHWHASHPILQKHHSSLFTETPHHGKLAMSTGTLARGAVDKPTRPLMELHVHSHRTVVTREAPGPAPRKVRVCHLFPHDTHVENSLEAPVRATAGGHCGEGDTKRPLLPSLHISVCHLHISHGLFSKCARLF